MLLVEKAHGWKVYFDPKAAGTIHRIRAGRTEEGDLLAAVKAQIELVDRDARREQVYDMILSTEVEVEAAHG